MIFFFLAGKCDYLTQLVFVIRHKSYFKQILLNYSVKHKNPCGFKNEYDFGLATIHAAAYRLDATSVERSGTLYGADEISVGEEIKFFNDVCGVNFSIINLNSASDCLTTEIFVTLNKLI